MSIARIFKQMFKKKTRPRIFYKEKIFKLKFKMKKMTSLKLIVFLFLLLPDLKPIRINTTFFKTRVSKLGHGLQFENIGSWETRQNKD